MINKKKFYHLSSRYLGEEFILKPRIYKGDYRGSSKKPRVCFSTSVVGAIKALGSKLFGNMPIEYYVYSTRGNFVPMTKVFDVHQTHEVASYKPVKVTFEYPIIIEGIREGSRHQTIFIWYKLV